MVDKKTIPCDVCGKSFDSSKALEKHKDSAHNDTSKLEAIGLDTTRSVLHSKKLVIAATIGILLAISAGVGVYSTMGINSNSQNGLTIDGIPCNTMEQLQFHIHDLPYSASLGKSYYIYFPGYRGHSCLQEE